MTPHIADCLHIGAHPHTLGIGADHVPIQHTRTSKHALHKSSTCPNRPQDKLHDKRNPRVMIDDPQMDFYSSDNNSRNSKDDPDHLN